MTDAYPYGKGEQYLSNELPYLASIFQKVVLCPIRIQGDAREIPLNSEIYNIHKEVNWSFGSKMSVFLKSIKLALDGNRFSKEKISFVQLLKTAINACLYAKTLNQKFDKSERVVFYSYWFYHWAFILSIIKRFKPSAKCVSRVHMGDIYDEIKCTPFKSVKLKQLSAIYPISKHCESYILNYYPDAKKILNVQYLGVKSLGQNPSERTDAVFYKVVTCSSIREAKRLDFIADVMSYSKMNICWEHFGDGPDKSLLEAKLVSLPNNIKVHLKGHTDNTQIHKYYNSEHIDLFINLSSQEGLPVSLMEAISYGIPVMGTNVYGTPEIVTNETGVLVELSESAIDVAKRLDDMLMNQKVNSEDVKELWREKFNADTNYERFAQILIKL